MYKYLIFDLDDTVLDFTGGEVAGIEKIFSDAWGLSGTALDEAVATYQKINHELWHQYEKDEIPRQQIFETRFPKTLAALGRTGDADQMEKDYAYLRNHNFLVVDQAKELLQELSRKYTLIAGTNGQADAQRLRLRETGLGQYFTQIYTSEDVGYSKPDTGFYDPIFRNNPDMRSDNTLMIGDGLYSDILGGQNYQLDTAWINRRGLKAPAEIQPTYEVEKLADLYPILK
ncbi:YjjG family noncanonical pyrimidine nucleotidase [Leuconostocaceae bacterium ESL0723]|nr:YjjG family noncanonical pyrimidine nucleotidase [Lactobacillaceae bacterium L1_55_11]WEV53831.1 YjjG family noncanonical pyrimidine nucleotidase [Leuconostocaceae bacterium ESL0723]